MKNSILIVGVIILGALFLIGAGSHWSGPIVSGTSSDAATANVATGAGDIFADDAIECDGNLNVGGTITGAGAVTLTGDQTITGDVSVTGGISATTSIDGPTVLEDAVAKSSCTLTTSDLGKIIVCTDGTAGTYNLPVSSVSTDGAKIAIKQTGGANILTIGRQASDTIDKASGDNTDINADNDILVFQNDAGNNDWLIIGGYIH